MENQDIDKLIALSPYAAETLRRWPDLLTGPEPPLDGADEAELLRQLRRHKHYWQLHQLLELLAGRLDPVAFLEATSRLAERLIGAALDWQHRALVARYGDPGQRLTVLGMGKLGGGELNFSSDIDLIFCHRSGGSIDHNGKETDVAVFFTKLAQKLIHSLDSITADGGVYRVDMRLRPFGASGALVLTHDALEQYYTIHGRDWERYALMKARPVAGDLDGGAQILRRLRPFIYRRYLDYHALQAIGQMKNTINQQISDGSLARNIKLGAGGIREAEFSVQAMQMVYGGQYPQLQRQNFRAALYDLAALQFWAPAEVARLEQAYLLLRTVENALQLEHEAQTHDLPTVEDEAGWQRLARCCGRASPAELMAELAEAREFIHRWFNGIFGAETAETDSAIDWQKPEEIEALPLVPEVKAALLHFCAHFSWARLSKASGGHLARILAQLSARPTAAGLPELLALLEGVATRSAYLYLLAEHPALIDHLLDIATTSAWLMRFIIEHPLVLDDILTERPLPPGAELAAALAARTPASLSDEEFFYALRDFKHGQIFKIAWLDIHGRLPLMQVSDRLTQLAELILAASYRRVRAQLEQRHGTPRASDGRPARFALVAYGKLGGLELGYGSDLDLIFLYDDGSGGRSDGPKPLENNVYFTRLAPRIITCLSSATTSGVLYAIDTRLRPNGSSGLLISHIDAYRDYQRHHAQTWEQQALTRARFIAGDGELGERFAAIRGEILALPREEEALRAAVLAMREKISAGHRLPPPEQFNLKYSPGGLVDIEFIVQYLLLGHCGAEPLLARMSDNIRQLAALEATGILSSSRAMQLRDSYRRLRLENHHRRLNDHDNNVPRAPWAELIATVRAIWDEIFHLTPENPQP